MAQLNGKLRQYEKPTGNPTPQPIVRLRTHNGCEEENQEAQERHGDDGFLHPATRFFKEFLLSSIGSRSETNYPERATTYHPFIQMHRFMCGL
jgi:hypothetical protein